MPRIRHLLAAILLAAAFAAAAAALRQRDRARAACLGLESRNRDITGRLETAVAFAGSLREEVRDLRAQLEAATNSTLNLSADQQAQLEQHRKLRAEIARLSEENVTQDTQLEQLRVALADGRAAQYKAEETGRLAQSQAAAFSNEVNRIRALEADKAARLAAREQELAAKTQESNARATELTAAQGVVKQLEAKVTATEARAGAAEANVKALQAQLADAQAKLAATQAEIAALKAKIPPEKAPEPATP